MNDVPGKRALGYSVTNSFHAELLMLLLKERVSLLYSGNLELSLKKAASLAHVHAPAGMTSLRTLKGAHVKMMNCVWCVLGKLHEKEAMPFVYYVWKLGWQNASKRAAVLKRVLFFCFASHAMWHSHARKKLLKWGEHKSIYYIIYNSLHVVPPNI